jgi:hypothetical protein
VLISATSAAIAAFSSSPARSRDHAAEGLLRRAANRRLQCPWRRVATTWPWRCGSHARRKVFNLTKGGSATVSGELLARISQLYPNEAEIRGQSAEARRQTQRQRSAPLFEALKSWLEEQLARLPARSQTAEALRYVLTRRAGRRLFLDDGRLELDTKPVELAMLMVYPTVEPDTRWPVDGAAWSPGPQPIAR